MKKTWNFFKNFIIIAYILLIIFVTICLLSYNDYKVTEFGKYTLLPVVDDYLEPDYKVGDLLIIEKNDLDDVKLGDIIFYYRTARGITTVNYSPVIELERVTDTETTFTAVGDIRFSSSYFMGKADTITVIPQLGKVLGLLQSKWGFLFLGVFPSLLAFLYTLYSVITEVKNDNVVEEVPKKKKKKKKKPVDSDSSENIDDEKLKKKKKKKPVDSDSSENIDDEKLKKKKKKRPVEDKEDEEVIEEKPKKKKPATEETEETDIEKSEKVEEKEVIKEEPKVEKKVEEKQETKVESKAEVKKEEPKQAPKQMTEEEKKALIEAKMKTMTEEQKKALIEAKLKSMTPEQKKALIEAKKKKMMEDNAKKK